MRDERPKGSPVEEGQCYEFSHGPTSHEGRKLKGVLEEIDERQNTYNFTLEDGTPISLVMHEVQAPRLVPEGC